MLKSILLLSTVMLAANGRAYAGPAAPQEGAQTAPKSNADVPAHVRKIYELDCAFCHGADGSGKSDAATDMKLNLMDWTDPKTLAGKSDEELFQLIRKGNDKMPPEDESRAKNEDVRHLIVYIRGMAKDKNAPDAEPQPAAASTPAAPGLR